MDHKNHLSHILFAIKKFTGINELELKKKSRQKPIPETRYMFSYLAKTQLRWKDEETAKFLNQDRTSIIYSRNTHKKFIESDRNYKKIFEYIKLELGFDFEEYPGIKIEKDDFINSRMVDKKIYIGMDLY